MVTAVPRKRGHDFDARCVAGTFSLAAADHCSPLCHFPHSRGQHRASLNGRAGKWLPCFRCRYQTQPDALITCTLLASCRPPYWHRRNDPNMYNLDSSASADHAQTGLAERCKSRQFSRRWVFHADRAEARQWHEGDLMLAITCVQCTIVCPVARPRLRLPALGRSDLTAYRRRHHLYGVVSPVVYCTVLYCTKPSE